MLRTGAAPPIRVHSHACTHPPADASLPRRQVFLNGDRGAYYDLLFSQNPDSLCKHAPMDKCVANPPTG